MKKPIAVIAPLLLALAAFAPANVAVQLTWDAPTPVPNAPIVGYNVYQRGPTNAPFVLVGTTTNQNFVVSDLGPSQIGYGWRVAAFNAQEGDPSDETRLEKPGKSGKPLVSLTLNFP